MTTEQPQRTETTLTTRSHYAFQVRAAETTDQPALAEFFAHVGKDDLRFRFLSPINTVGPHLIATLANVDHDRTENILAFDADGKTVIASAMLAADIGGKRAEVAMAIRADHKRKGVSWTLLEHVARLAEAKGIETLESIEARDHHEAIDMEREMGFTASPSPGDPTLVLLQVKLGQK
jgi:N-acetylglutamate synthase-like GNAT family acetyltransferase